MYKALTPPLSAGTLTPSSFLDTATQLIGLGEGLTPSGDDFLVGLLAVFHPTGKASTILTPPVRHQFVQLLATATSDLSAEFLRCALEGHFAEPIVDLIRAQYALDKQAWLDHTADLASTGHSSGIDAMVGMVVGGRLVASSLARTPAVDFSERETMMRRSRRRDEEESTTL
jgi:hypothetical protein